MEFYDDGSDDDDYFNGNGTYNDPVIDYESRDFMYRNDDTYYNDTYYNDMEEDERFIEWNELNKQIEFEKNEFMKARQNYKLLKEQYCKKISILHSKKLFKSIDLNETILILENNFLYNIDDVCEFKKLEYLNISNTRITSLPENLPNSLTNLYCCENMLVSLPENLPHSLKSIICTRNNIQYLPTILPVNLEYINIYKNYTLNELYDTDSFKLQDKYSKSSEAIEELMNHIFYINVIKRIGNNTNKMALLNANGAFLEHWAKITGKPSNIDFSA